MPPIRLLQFSEADGPTNMAADEVLVRTAAERAYASTSAGLVLLGLVAVLAAIAIIVLVRPTRVSTHMQDPSHGEHAKAS